MRATGRDIAAREAKLEALQNKLTESVTTLVSGEDWKRAMEFAAKFRSRSFNNTLLIAVAHLEAHLEGRVPEPMPTYVAGFHQWQTLGRSVMKGQVGYPILAPVTARYATTSPADPGSWHRLARGERPGPGETVRSKLVGLKPAYVWDISQTDGAPIPETPQPVLLRGRAPEGLWAGLANQITAHGFGLRLVSDATHLGGANGVTDFTTREVSVRMDMDDAAQAKTLAHELGHVLLHGTDNVDAAMHRGVAEVEAESFALMLAAAHGLSTEDYTIPYVATWAASVPGMTPTEVVHSTADRVRSAALTTLERLDTPQVGDGTPPGLDRTTRAGNRMTTAHTREPAQRPVETIGMGHT